MTGEPELPRTSSAEAAEAVAAQVRDVRDVLRTDAAAAGIDVERVDAAVDTAFAGYAKARVHGFIGVLVERDVRSALGLGRAAPPTTTADETRAVARITAPAAADATRPAASAPPQPRSRPG